MQTISNYATCWGSFPAKYQQYKCSLLLFELRLVLLIRIWKCCCDSWGLDLIMPRRIFVAGGTRKGIRQLCSPGAGGTPLGRGMHPGCSHAKWLVVLWLDRNEWDLAVGATGWERTMLLSRFLQHLFDPLWVSGPKASLLAKKVTFLVLWAGSGLSLWAATAVGCKPEP